jgi:hypothetical protein
VNATSELAKLCDQRARAEDRVDQLEREARTASAAVAEASAALIAFERDGGTPEKRRELEQALAAARAKQAEPWGERIAGARAALRDVDVSLRAFTAEHFAELVEDKEADGRAVAARVDGAAGTLISLNAELQGVAREIAALASQVGVLQPGDVAFSRAEALVREAQRLVANGGEAAPVLRRDREPWSRLLGAERAMTA